jgi:hypothetical protein
MRNMVIYRSRDNAYVRVVYKFSLIFRLIYLVEHIQNINFLTTACLIEALYPTSYIFFKFPKALLIIVIWHPGTTMGPKGAHHNLT